MPAAVRRPHACRTDLDREEDRALDPLRPMMSKRKSSTVAAASLSFRSRHHLRLRAVGRQRLRNRQFRASISCAPSPRGESYQTLPFVRPGGEILLHIDGWPKVERVLQAIDAVEAIGVDPADVAPDHWRHVHSRLTPGDEPRPYTRDRHARGCRAGGSAMTRFGWVMTAPVRARRRRRRVLHPRPRLLWNASASMPIGLYDPSVRQSARHRTCRRHSAGAPRQLSRRARLSAARRAAAEARPRPSRANRLPRGARHQRRWDRDGRGPRPRQQGPPVGHLAGLPAHRQPARSF